MKKCDYNFIFIFIALVLVFGIVSTYIRIKNNSEPIKEYSPKYELVNVKTEIITISENAANVVLVQDIRYTLTYIEDGKPCNIPNL